MRCMGETRTSPPCPAHALASSVACGERFALCGQDTHVSTLSRTCVRRALRAVWARHARVLPVPNPRAGGGASRCLGKSRETCPCPRQSALPRTCVRGALRDVWARHTRVHLRALPRSPMRGTTECLAMYRRANHVTACLPVPHLYAGSACMGETRTCPPRPALACSERFALYGRACRVCPVPHSHAGNASRCMGVSASARPIPHPGPVCGKRFAM